MNLNFHHLGIKSIYIILSLQEHHRALVRHCDKICSKIHNFKSCTNVTKVCTYFTQHKKAS